MNDYKDIWIFAEQRNGKLMNVAIEILGEARKLADKKGVNVGAVLIGHNVENLSKDLISLALT